MGGTAGIHSGDDYLEGKYVTLKLVQNERLERSEVFFTNNEGLSYRHVGYLMNDGPKFAGHGGSWALDDAERKELAALLREHRNAVSVTFPMQVPPEFLDD